MQKFPKNIEESIVSVSKVLRQIVRIREDDITDRNTFDSIFMRGRKVAKIPSGSTDVETTDRIGDFNYDVSYFYLLVDNSGVPVWRRAGLVAW